MGNIDRYKHELDRDAEDARPELSDVLDEIQLSGEDLSPDNISYWMKKYPRFADEILEFAAFKAVVENVPDPEDPPPVPPWVSEKRLERVRRIVRAAVRREGTDEAAGSLRWWARERGLRFPELARRVGLPLSLLANLEQRFVRFGTIPEGIFGRFSEVLGVPAETVREYFRRPPRMTPQAEFKAQDRPEVPDQEDFYTLVERDPMLTPEQKKELYTLRD